MLVLGICLYYSLSYVFSVPYLGFVISGDWTVTSLESICGEDISQCAIGGTWLQPDDQLVKIGDLDFLDYETNQWASPYENYTTGDTLSLIVERGGKQYQLQWKIPEPALVERVVRSLGMLIFLPYWLAGTIILLFLRPRDASWRLLTVLFLGLAIWLVAGVVSSYRFSGSVPIARSMSWVLSAVFVHFHLLVPSPLISPVSLKRSMVVVYAVAVLGATASLFGLISGTLAYGVLLISILGSLLLLAYHTIFRRADKSSRVASRLMLIGSGLAFGPSVLFWVLPGLLSLSTPGFLTTAFITAALPLQPFFYIYAIYKRSLGDLEFRVSRILASYSYLILFATGFVIVYMIAGQVLGYDNNLLSFSLLMSALLLAGAFLLQDRYLRVVRKMAYGTTHDPDHIVTLFANAIPQALNHQALADLLVKEMLPAMLIRQSALVVVAERGVRPIYATAIEEERLPAKQPVVQHLMETVKTYRSPELTPPDQYDWVRLALPVKLGEDILGAWLFGKRDPDDFYPLPDVTLLTTLASQIGVALQNIRLIEDLRQRADELQAANDELRELDKLKEEFIQNISHELRTPLTLVQGYVELMREGLLGEVNVEQKEALDIAFDRTLFTVRMVDDIISMQQALAEQMVMAPVDMAELAKKSLRMAELAGRKEQISADGTIRSRHQFELRLKGEVPLVMGARSRLGQVLDNLLGNAIKFSPDGGEIAIEIEPCYHRYDVGHSDLVPLPAVEISVRDQGVGIPASKIEHIWDRFFQVDGSSTRQFGGMGLGLSIVKEIVTSHEGFVWAESREGVGSIFRFVLPTQETFARVRKA